ncbi:sensor histidine kinase [Streptomyces bambusae]|uniref:histidine kinase n=1 Tax=Streptomyces bambusae TaxID=1550616 RepID=A0ABS6Z839_9ACTN|nr:histidine kinase [Streptomyces bambusae]MBW5483917.1 sensor histidine kinase [Streptomyces bambusae]
MSSQPALPLFKRLPPGGWVALAWCAGTALTFLLRFRLPGEQEPTIVPGVQLFRWDGLTQLLMATALVFKGAQVLERRPVAAMSLLLLGAAVGTTALSTDQIPLLQFLAADVALYFVAAHEPRRTSLVALASALGTLAAFQAVRLLFAWSSGTATALTVGLTAAVAWLLGRSAGQAREHAEESRAQAAVQAVTAERLRIARELHDMVAHSIGVIALQAGAAGRVIETQPAAAREALGAIETAGRETLSGLRRMLGALREADRADGREAGPAPLDPAPPGLADVERLAAATSAAGVRVDVVWQGELRPLPAEIDMSAYRIVQEAVTNVVRHAGVSSCRVTIGCDAEELSIAVVDDGRGTGPAGASRSGSGSGSGRPSGSRRSGPGASRESDPGASRRSGPGGSGPSGSAWGGYGLLGMRERVHLLHGEFSAAPRPEGGFRVTARLPVPTGAP